MLRRTWLPVLPVLLVLVGLVVSPAADAQSSGSSTSTTTNASYTTTEFEYSLLSRTNQRRTNVGCARLRWNAYLVKAARMHSSRMATARTLSHKLPYESSFSVRITKAGYTNWTAVAENIAYGSPDPAVIFRSWMGSSTHRANIDNCRYRDVGIGVAYGGGYAWVTMDLGRR